MVAPGGYRFSDHAVSGTTLNTINSDQTASVLFATAFNQSPLGANSPVSISDTNAAYLQQVAADTMGY